MYPVGLLFGLGFDTATEIALLVLAGTSAAAGLAVVRHPVPARAVHRRHVPAGHHRRLVHELRLRLGVFQPGAQDLLQHHHHRAVGGRRPADRQRRTARACSPSQLGWRGAVLGLDRPASTSTRSASSSSACSCSPGPSRCSSGATAASRKSGRHRPEFSTNAPRSDDMRDISAASDCPETVACTLRRAQLDRVGFSEVSYAAATKLVASSPGDCYQVQLTLAGHCEISTGPVTVRAGPGSFVVINPRTTYRKRWSSDARQLMIRLPRRTVEQLASAESGRYPVLFDQSARPMPGALRDLIDFIWRDITTDGRRRSAVVDRSASRHLVRAVLHLLPNSASMVAPANDLPELSVPCRPVHPTQPRARYRPGGHRRCCRRQHALSGERISPALADHTGDPLAQRAARHRAPHADSNRSTEHPSRTWHWQLGFPHLGRFSREYSRRFGELPSESLRRAPATT